VSGITTRRRFSKMDARAAVSASTEGDRGQVAYGERNHKREKRESLLDVVPGRQGPGRLAASESLRGGRW